MEKYDIVIVGMGPAGSTLARLLDSRFRLAVIDRKTADGEGFHKPCGGLLAPDAQKALSRLNLTLPKAVLVDPQIFAVRTLDMPSGLVRWYQRFYINLNRHRFDLWLRSLIPSRVTLYDDGNCIKIERVGSGFELRFIRYGREEIVEAKYIVGADGANSAVRRFIYPRWNVKSYVSIQQWFKERHPHPFYSCLFDPAVTDCYSWTISKDGFFIFGGAYPKKDCRRLFELQKQRMKDAGFLFDEPVITEGCQVLRPTKFTDFRTGRDGVFLVGEAGGFISPSSLEGISSAFNTAVALASVLNSKASNPAAAYRRKTLPLRLRLFLKVLKTPFLYHPLLRRLVMKSGIKSIRMIHTKTQ